MAVKSIYFDSTGLSCANMCPADRSNWILERETDTHTQTQTQSLRILISRIIEYIP